MAVYSKGEYGNKKIIFLKSDCDTPPVFKATVTAVGVLSHAL
jgi:hypothetical protein